MKINVEIADTELENNEIDINKMGTLAEQEHEIPPADVLAKSIMCSRFWFKLLYYQNRYVYVTNYFSCIAEKRSHPRISM
jgi:hypothetical protein